MSPTTSPTATPAPRVDASIASGEDAGGEHVLAITALDRPRTLAAVTTLLVGRGHHVRWLDAAPDHDGRTLVTVGLPLDEHAAERVALQLERLTEVLHVAVLEAATTASSPDIERYHLTTRGAAGTMRCEAVVSLCVDGIRTLGAGEGTRPVDALSQATLSALGRPAAGARVDAARAVRSPAGWCGVAVLSDEGGPHAASSLDRVEERAVVGAVMRAAREMAGRAPG
jgi:acetolactate synthase regulatory subunit